MNISTKTNSNRALALDALRGFAILGMIFSSRIPETLPGWMFHAQNPPPSHAFVNTPGITWVDLVFPFFLFAMGAAFPFALNKKLESGKSYFNIVTGILLRGILLAIFAIIIQHIRPTSLSKSPDFNTNLISLGLFVLLFLSYVRLPGKLPRIFNYLMKFVGFGGIALFLYFVKYPDGSGFLLKRSDIIILVLANVSVFGSLIWLFSRNNLLLRLAVFGVLLAFRLTANIDGSWTAYIWNNFQIPWLFKIYYIQYLFIVIPGTIIGDIIYSWITDNSNSDKNNTITVSKFESAILAFLLILYIGFSVTAFYCRWITLLVITTLILFILLFYYFRFSNNTYNIFFTKLFNWAIYWMLLGLMFEPYEGGIQKGKATISFYFTTVSLAILFFMFLYLLIHSLNFNKILSIFILSGQNPMLAYAGGTNMLTPLVSIFYIDKLLAELLTTPWLGAFKGFLLSILLFVIVSVFTKKKIYWRS